jgi:hypothetical protein
MTPFMLRVLDKNDLVLARQLFEMWRQGDEVTALPATDETWLSLLSRDDFHVVVALRDDHVIGGLMAYELVMYTRAATELFIYESGVEEAH